MDKSIEQRVDDLEAKVDFLASLQPRWILAKWQFSTISQTRESGAQWVLARLNHLRNGWLYVRSEVGVTERYSEAKQFTSSEEAIAFMTTNGLARYEPVPTSGNRWESPDDF